MKTFHERDLNVDKTLMYSAGVLTNRNSDFYPIIFLSCKPKPLQHPDLVPNACSKQLLYPSIASPRGEIISISPCTCYIKVVVLRNNTVHFSRFNQRVLLSEQADEQIHSEGSGTLTSLCEILQT